MKECLRDESTLTSIKCCLMFYADLLVYIYAHHTYLYDRNDVATINQEDSRFFMIELK